MPLLAELWASLGSAQQILAIVLIGVSLANQVASIAFPNSFEETQHGYTPETFLLGHRYINIVGVATGRAREWGLDGAGTVNQPVFEQGLVPNLLPFRLRYRGMNRLSDVASMMVIFVSAIAAVQLGSLLRSYWRGDFHDQLGADFDRAGPTDAMSLRILTRVPREPTPECPC